MAVSRSVVLAACCVSTVAALVRAQDRPDAGADAGSVASSSAVRLRTGFVPDPADFGGRASGERPASELDAACTGFVPSAPSTTLELETRFGFLRIFATGGLDLALAVRHSDGTVQCSDDRFGIHPAIEGLFLPGRLEVWVGTKTRGASGPYSLRVTETRSMRPGLGMDSSEDSGTALGDDLGLEVESSEPALGQTDLQRGFLPDPRWLEGDATGTIDIVSLGGLCRGFVAAKPSYLVTLQDDFDYLQIYLMSDRSQGGVLAVLGPTGRFICDVVTSTEGAEVSAPRWGRGVYRVWVGTSVSGATLGHRVGISEVRRVR
jgi:hypothetical protein